jgi:ATP-dependent RNA helicase A
LRGVSHVIVDEIHERDINTDFLLVLLRDMIQIHKGLKIILMSATIDTTLFSDYFMGSPVFEIYGRTFPVQEYFLEDIVQMLDFVPMLKKKRKNKSNNDDDDEDECDEAAVANTNGEEVDDTDCNTLVSNDYSDKTRNAMKQLSEKSLSFELIESLIKYIRTLNQPGAILIFMPGWNLISALLKFMREDPVLGNSNEYILLPLHSQIAREEQYKVFEDPPAGITKIIVSTNIAESSITIHDIVFVIDSCKVKQKIFTSRNNLTNYATVYASKSNLDQRKGRAGRVRSGYAFFLVSRARYERLENHATPEIFRTPLLELALSIKLLRLGEIKEFLARAIEPPPLDAVTEAIIQLTEMDALDVGEELTPLGKILARLPIEPRLGKMIIMGCIFFVGDAVCTIAAATTFTEPFVNETRYLRLLL